MNGKFFTDDDGDLILPEALKIGNYRIEEVSAPYGYVVNDKYVRTVRQNGRYQRNLALEDQYGRNLLYQLRQKRSSMTKKQ